MAVTIKDVAARCGLSVSTVSKAFNDYSDISPRTQELVRRTAREIGYFPNAIARTLKTNRSYNLGVLFNDERQSGLTHAFFASLLNAFKTESERRGYDITFINHHIARAGMTYLEHCQYRNVDGVFIACVDFRIPEVLELGASRIPCVTVDHVYAGRSAVVSDNGQGMRLLTERAIALGHRRIALISGDPSMVTDSRVNGFLTAMRKAGLPIPEGYLVKSLYDTPAGAREATLALLRREDRPSCIFLPDDHCCLGALQAAQEMGLRVPEDLSIAGFDGIEIGQCIRPMLTTIRQDTRAMGSEAARLLISRVEDPAFPFSTVQVPVTLLTGESLGSVPMAFA
ncbi:MAG: LacI family DNA-binding transcriptional regulator [Aristaeellaceae bacterium]